MRWGPVTVVGDDIARHYNVSFVMHFCRAVLGNAPTGAVLGHAPNFLRVDLMAQWYQRSIPYYCTDKYNDNDIDAV